jgi:alpha-tubulin suppressor-like RCC1 family protein
MRVRPAWLLCLSLTNAACGQDSFSPPVLPAVVVQVALGSDYGCARFSDGTLQCWGSNQNGQAGRPVNNTMKPGIVPGLKDVEQVVIGQATVARLADGTVWGWGYNDAGQLGLHNFGGDHPARIPEVGKAEQISTSILTCGLERNDITCVGTPLDGGGGVDTKIQHFDGHDVRTLLDGCLIMTDGSLECWGVNLEGEVGVGDKKPRATPTHVLGLKDVVSAVSGGQFTCAVVRDGSAYCWGTNWAGQLGTGDTISRDRPARVVDVPRLKVIAAGHDHACGVSEDGSVYCWGDDGADALGFHQRVLVPNPIPRKLNGLTDVVDIAAGTLDTCAIKQDHTVWCWGENTSGALGGGFASDESAKPVEVKFAGSAN